MRRFIPLILIAAILAAAAVTGLQHELSWQALASRQAELAELVAARPLLAALAYVAIYTGLVAVSFPGSVIVTVAGGLLFGTALGAALTVISATVGATLLFLAARGVLAPFLAARARPFLARIGPRLARDGFSYLLALRLVPIVPFWLVNFAPALLGMRVAPFVLATFIGIIPGTVVFTSIGAGVGDVLSAGGRPDLSVIFSAPVFLPLLGLATLSLLPVFLRRRLSREKQARAV